MNSLLLLAVAATLVWAARVLVPAEVKLRLSQYLLFGSLIWLQFSGKKGDVYDVLWALVFGFATINILSLGLRRFDPGQNRLNFGEMLAVLVVVVSIFLLGWEMLALFKVFPIKLKPR
ncbi:MAG TPA: hypothetical protein VFJ47_09730 [Terriglobales bacterium]|nr:hypothetical protein [Terriglobales bacterium]